MARVAASGSIDEALNTLMVRGHPGLIAVLVAGNAGEDRKVRRIRMAIGTRSPFAVVGSAIDGEVRGIMGRELRAGPIHGGVAGIAGRWESRGRVVGVGGVLIVELVATVAIGGRRGVVVAHVALDALVIGQHGGVKACQGERRGGVVEGGAGPVGSGVAHGAILRESGCLVRWISGSVVVGLVTVPAGGAGEAEIVVYVALGALQAGVRAGQGEAGCGVIEGGAGPIGGGVASGAVLRETGGSVRRVVGVVVVGLMAAPASPAGEAVVVIDVTLRALEIEVRAGQGEAGGGVVESRAGPVSNRRTVTQSAVLGESRSLVGRIVGVVVIDLVAAPARGAGEAVVVVDMTCRALLGGVRPYQREAGGGVVECRTVPVRSSMTPQTVLGEIGGLVRRVVGVVVVGQVAVDAGAAGEAVVIVDMALRALEAGVSAGQCETGGVMVERRAGPVRNCRAVTYGAVLREPR